MSTTSTQKIANVTSIGTIHQQFLVRKVNAIRQAAC